MLVGRRSGPSTVTSLPAISIVPEVGSTKPPIMRRSVVLPQPDGPRIAKKSPRRISRSTGLTADVLPKLFETFRSRRSASIKICVRVPMPPCIRPAGQAGWQGRGGRSSRHRHLLTSGKIVDCIQILCQYRGAANDDGTSMNSPIAAAGITKGLAHRTLAAATAEELRRRILTGSFPAGYQLRQDALASEFGISRIPLREALLQLEAEGLIKIIPHRGAVVSELSIAEIEELF